MFDHTDYANAGYSSDETIGDLSDTLLDLATSFLPGAPLQQGAELALDSTGLSNTSPLASSLGPSTSTATVTAPSGLKVREQPATTARDLALLSYGTVVTVIQANAAPASTNAPKGWTRVRTASGTEGYMSTEWLSISTPTSASSGSTFAPLANASSSSGSSSASLSTTKPTTPAASSSIFDNKLLVVGGGVLVLAVVGAIFLGGDTKKKAA